MNPVGLWTLHFDWGPKGNYSWTPLYFNFDGTFAYLAGANEGTWAQVDDSIIWRFKKQLCLFRNLHKEFHVWADAVV